MPPIPSHRFPTCACPLPHTQRDCWTVAFGHAFNAHDRIVGAGYDNGDVKLFDLRAMALRWETNLKNGVCSLQFDRKDIEMNKVVIDATRRRTEIGGKRRG